MGESDPCMGQTNPEPLVTEAEDADESLSVFDAPMAGMVLSAGVMLAIDLDVISASETALTAAGLVALAFTIWALARTVNTARKGLKLTR